MSQTRRLGSQVGAQARILRHLAVTGSPMRPAPMRSEAKRDGATSAPPNSPLNGRIQRTLSSEPLSPVSPAPDLHFSLAGRMSAALPSSVASESKDPSKISSATDFSYLLPPSDRAYPRR